MLNQGTDSGRHK